MSTCVFYGGITRIGVQENLPIWQGYLGIPDYFRDEWSSYCEHLRGLGMLKNSRGDRVGWGGTLKKGQIVIRETYQVRMKKKLGTEHAVWSRGLWKLKVQTKIIFFWLVWHDKNLTWSNLQKRGIEGPGVCRHCLNAGENNYHLFYECIFARDVTQLVCTQFNITAPNFQSTIICYEWWGRKGKSFRIMPIIYHWYMWISRNRWLFDGKPRHPSLVSKQILHLWKYSKIKQNPPRDLSIRNCPQQILYPAGFFDWAAQNSKCGCGAWLMLSPSCHYKIYWVGSQGTNKRAESQAL